jgi:hypothetical protein
MAAISETIMIIVVLTALMTVPLLKKMHKQLKSSGLKPIQFARKLWLEEVS